jgi:hypothetical protein
MTPTNLLLVVAIGAMALAVASLPPASAASVAICMYMTGRVLARRLP